MFEEFKKLEEVCHIHFEFKSDDLGTFNKFLNIIHKYEYRYSFYTLDNPSREQKSSQPKINFDSINTDEKIKIIKILREITGLGLKEAKELVDNSPAKVKAIIGSSMNDTSSDSESKIMAFDINIPKNFSLIREIRDFCMEYGNIFTNASEVENNQTLRKWLKEAM